MNHSNVNLNLIVLHRARIEADNKREPNIVIFCELIVLYAISVCITSVTLYYIDQITISYETSCVKKTIYLILIITDICPVRLTIFLWKLFVLQT